MERGNRLRMRGRIIDIGLHDGIATVVEQRDGIARRYSAGEWFRLNRGAIALARASRRSELGIEALLPTATLDELHASRRRGLAQRTAARVARWLRNLRPALSAS